MLPYSGMAPSHDAEDDREPLLINRRNVLTATGVGIIGGLTTVGTVSAATTVDLGAQGLQEGDQIDPYLEQYFVDGNEVHIPAGTYQWNGDGLNAGANAALIGDGNVVFDTGEGGAVATNVVAQEGTVLIKNITQRGTDVGKGRIAAWAESGATLVFENFNRPDGGEAGGDGDPIGFFTPPEHAGKMVYRNCTVSGWPNNGLYASGPQKGGGGQVVVEGGLYKNNNVASVRIGSDNSIVRNVTIVHDGPIPRDGGGGSNGRALWVRFGGENIRIENCDITVTGDSDGATFPVGIHPRDFAGSGVLRNCRIWNGNGSEPVEYHDEVIGDWAGSGNQLSGGGNLSLDSPVDSWIACVDNGCATPTRKKQIVGEDGSGGDGGSGGSPSPIAVSTRKATDVTGSEATLNGTLNDLGGANSANVAFQYQEAGASSWQSTSARTLSSTGGYSATVEGLSGSTDYEFRAVTTGSGGSTASGSTNSFTTGTTKTSDHHLVIEMASDSGITYSATTTGQIRPGDAADLENNDAITQNGDGTYTVEGEIGGGYTDDWWFSGEITTWSAQQRPQDTNDAYRLYLDGSETNPSDIGGPEDGSSTEHQFVIETVEGSGVIYSFTASGAVRPNSKAEVGNNDSITQNDDGTYTVEGETGHGYVDDYTVVGEITNWNVEQHPDDPSGEHTLYWDGSEVSPSELTGSGATVSEADGSGDDDPLPNRIVFSASDGESGSYAFEVSGEVEPDPEVGPIEGNDNISGSAVEGVFDSGVDAYRFSGDIVDLELRGNTAVSIDDND